MVKNIIESAFEKHLETIGKTALALSGDLERCGIMLVEALTAGRKILIMGNGGSAADSQHFAAEIAGRFLRERKALPALALSTDTSILTAVSNDFGFEEVFKRQVEALAKPGDVIVGISTSGRSENVRRALSAGREMGCRTIGILGGEGGTIREMVEIPLIVPSEETPRIQETHVLIIHILCELIDAHF